MKLRPELYVWLRVGTYFTKDQAAEVAARLSDAGARVEIKQSVDWEIEERRVLRKKLSELGGEEAEIWEKYVSILRELLAKNLSVEEFEREFLARAEPEDFEMAKKIEEDEAFLDAAESALRLSMVMSSVYGFLRLNGVKIDDIVSGELPDDPEIAVEVEEGGEKFYLLTLFPVWDVHVDVLSLLSADVQLEGEEGIVVDAAARLLAMIAANAEDADIEELRELCVGIIEKETTAADGDVIVDGEDVLEEILRSLERVGLVRVTGRKVRRR